MPRQSFFLNRVSRFEMPDLGYRKPDLGFRLNYLKIGLVAQPWAASVRKQYLPAGVKECSPLSLVLTYQ